jgi:disease resistance protein RPM1
MMVMRQTFELLRVEVDAHPNPPLLQVSKTQGHNDLGGIEGSNVAAEATESLPAD